VKIVKQLLVPALVGFMGVPAGAIIINPGFESSPLGNLQIQNNPDVTNELDEGWFSLGAVTPISSGGNPGNFIDLTQAAPDQTTPIVVNIFSAPAGVTTDPQLIEFDYILSDIGGTPDFSDNVLTVELFGTNSTAPFNTRFQGSGVGAFWTSLISTTFALSSSTTGFESLTTDSADISGFDFYGVRVIADNFVDGGAQVGQEAFGLDNFSIAPVPEPGALALAMSGMMCFMIRRRQG